MGLSVEQGELLRRALDSRAGDIWTCLPAKVTSYDAQTQTADLEVCVRRPLTDDDGETTGEELPVIPNVLIQFPRGGGDTFAITWPLQAGDFVWIHVCTLAIGNWRRTGETSDPGDVRTHSLGNCYATPGAAPNANTLGQAQTNALVLEGPEIRAGKDASDFVGLATYIMNNLNAIKATLNSANAPSMGGPVTYGTPYNPTDVKASKLKAE